MAAKTCTKCGEPYPATRDFFYADKRKKDGLESECKKCHTKMGLRYSKTKKGRKVQAKVRKNYRQTLRGCLQTIYYGMRSRCTDTKRKNYHRYGGRGIKCNFKSFDDFVNYVTKELNITKLEQIKGLQIDRIDNNGHYEKGNIRWVTPQENISNKGPWNEKV